MNSPILGQDLGALSVFAVVAEKPSFTKAAVRLGVSRSAVSHSIQALEERLGLRLLARTTRAVAVTEAGQRLLVWLDLTSEDDTRGDLVAGRYDAGIHLGEFLRGGTAGGPASAARRESPVRLEEQARFSVKPATKTARPDVILRACRSPRRSVAL